MTIRKTVKTTTLLILLAISSFYLPLQFLEHWAKRENTNSTAISIELKNGEPLEKFAAKLKRKGAINNKLLFILWVKIKSNYRKFKSGPYRFQNESPQQIINKIISGQIHNSLVLSITVPEGFNIKKILNALSLKGLSISSSSWQRISAKLTNKFSIPSSNLEGYLFPATYKFYNQRPSLEVIISEMLQEFFHRVPSDYLEKIRKNNLSLHQAISFASLIEKESSIEEEKKFVSEVIWRRLKNNAPLGIDASIIYGIKNFNGNLTWKNLADKKICTIQEFIKVCHLDLFVLHPLLLYLLSLNRVTMVIIITSLNQEQAKEDTIFLKP